MWLWPLTAPGTSPISLKNGGMGHFVYVSNQESVWIKVTVNGDLLSSVGKDAEVAKPGSPGSNNAEGELKLGVQLLTVGNGGSGKVRSQLRSCHGCTCKKPHKRRAFQSK